MYRWLRTLLPFPLLLAVALSAPAQSSGVGLGLSVGVAFPWGQTDRIVMADSSGSFNWGFYVDIPLLDTVHLTPSSELYRLDQANATDIELAFKFILPLDRLKVFLGISPGLTAAGEETAFHVGALGGASMRLVSNLSFFGQVKYNVLFQGNRNIRILHTNLGLLFTL